MKTANEMDKYVKENGFLNWYVVLPLSWRQWRRAEKEGWGQSQ